MVERILKSKSMPTVFVFHGVVKYLTMVRDAGRGEDFIFQM